LAGAGAAWPPWPLTVEKATGRVRGEPAIVPRLPVIPGADRARSRSGSIAP
jgi:hypothetical protein